jgi:DeoR/GlpR family transcriptional regulator of sugar metabolism
LALTNLVQTKYSIGGQLCEDTDWLVGLATIQFIKNIHMDKCFLSAAGISISDGTTVPISFISEVE